MSLKSAPFYWVECDSEGCDARCPGSDNEDCIAYVTPDQATDTAECSEWTLTDDGKHFCQEHGPVDDEEVSE